MARALAKASSQYLKYSGAAAASAPLTLACWTMQASATTGVALSISNVAGTQNYYGIAVSATHFPFAFVADTPSGENDTFSPATASLNTWAHVCAIFASTASQAIYLNGGNKATSSATRTPSGLDTTAVGALINPGGGAVACWDGALAEAGIWNAALTDAEVLALSQGVSPRYIRPANLVAYWPLFGLQSPEPDLSGNGANMSPVNAPTFANHAPVRLFSRSRPYPLFDESIPRVRVQRPLLFRPEPAPSLFE